VSALGSVLAEARVGGTAESISARLGLARDLVDLMIDQGERLGLLGFAAPACGGCGGESATRADDARPSAGPAQAGCAGCLFAVRP
jgi:hypothetical protein